MTVMRDGRQIRIRAGQILGLLFLAGAVSDLEEGSRSDAQTVAIAVVLVAFVVLYLALLPPLRPLECRGPWALRAGIAALAGLAARRRSPCCSSTWSRPPGCCCSREWRRG
jgi:hypothetical protein